MGIILAFSKTRWYLFLGGTQRYLCRSWDYNSLAEDENSVAIVNKGQTEKRMAIAIFSKEHYNKIH